MTSIIDFRTPAAGFDQPIEMWLACHERVSRMLGLLERLRDHLAAGERGESAGITATSILRYFDEAAPRHHEDEDADLFPRLLAHAKGEEFDRLERLCNELRAEHAATDAAWAELRPALEAIAAGTPVPLDEALVERFVARYRAHVEREEDVLTPLFRRVFDAGELDEIGRAMAARRGVDWDTLVARREPPAR